jgi:hypothetical protein
MRGHVGGVRLCVSERSTAAFVCVKWRVIPPVFLSAPSRLPANTLTQKIARGAQERESARPILDDSQPNECIMSQADGNDGREPISSAHLHPSRPFPQHRAPKDYTAVFCLLLSRERSARHAGLYLSARGKCIRTRSVRQQNNLI